VALGKKVKEEKSVGSSQHLKRQRECSTNFPQRGFYSLLIFDYLFKFSFNFATCHEFEKKLIFFFGFT
jgi:hypothetical protein